MEEPEQRERAHGLLQVGRQSIIHYNLHVEYAGGRTNYGIICIFSLFYEYSKVNQADYGIRILVAASQKCVNIYSTPRPTPLHVE